MDKLEQIKELIEKYKKEHTFRGVLIMDKYVKEIENIVKGE